MGNSRRIESDPFITLSTIEDQEINLYDNSSLTFQAEIADRGGHERGEQTPGGEML